MTNGFRGDNTADQVAMNTTGTEGTQGAPSNSAAITTEASANEVSEVNSNTNNVDAYTAKTSIPAKEGSSAPVAKTVINATPKNSTPAVAKINAASTAESNNLKTNSVNTSTNNNTNSAAPVNSITNHVTTGTQQKTASAGPSAEEPVVASARDKVEMLEVNTITQNNRIRVHPITGEITVFSTETPGKAQIPVLASAEPAGTTQQSEPQKKENLLASSAPNASAPATAANTAPQAAAPSTGGSESGGSNNHSAGKSKRKGGWDFRGFNDMLDKAEYQLGNTKLNTGIVGGINTTFGNYDMRGFNIGLFGLFSFADGQSPWSLMLQARYSQYFNNRINTYSDNYTNYTPGTNGQFAQEEKEHYFKYSTASNINIPLVLQYTPYKSKFTFFGGADMNYYFKINAEETERTLSTTSVTTAQTNEVPLTLADFNSRFGVGAVLGVGYNINSVMRLDVRMAKGLWDNAKTPGAQRISGDLYKTPNLQLNLGVRLGKDKKEKQ